MGLEFSQVSKREKKSGHGTFKLVLGERSLRASEKSPGFYLMDSPALYLEDHSSITSGLYLKLDTKVIDRWRPLNSDELIVTSGRRIGG